MSAISERDERLTQGAIAVPPRPPDLSVVVVFSRRFEVLKRTIVHLRAQTIANRIELVVVAPSAHAMRELQEDELTGFHSVRVAVVGEITNVDKAGARGIEYCSAPIVAFVEDHAFPREDWAESVVRSHAGEWGVVGTAIVNGNPGTGWSWANHLVTYAPWLPHAPSGETSSVSRHNTSFKRAALDSLGSNLVSAFGRDGALLSDLRKADFRIYLDTNTSIAHVNPSKALTTLGLRFNAGRLFAHKRVKAGKWGWGKRAVYTAASPLYPLIRLRQIWSQSLKHESYRSLIPRIIPALSGALVADAVGQAVGYVAGPGRSVDTLADFEAERMPHLVATDRATLLTEEQIAAGADRVTTTEREVRLGIIGCGRIVQIAHMSAIGRAGSVRVSALADPDDNRLKGAALRAPGANPYSDWRSLLGDANVDAVLIAVPPALHAEVAIAAFEAGKHVYLEKPIAPSLADADRILRAWRSSRLVGMIGHNLRCHPVFLMLRNQLEQGVIGKPVFVRTAFTAAVRDLPQWKRESSAQGGGVLLDLATHHVDLCRFVLAEEVARAEVEEWSEHFPGDSARLHLTMQSGLRVESFFSLSAISDDHLEITGDRGRLHVDRYTGSLRIVPPRQSQSIRARVTREISGLAGAAKRVLQPAGEPSYAEALRRFVRAVREGGAALPDLDDGRKALEVVVNARHR